MKEIELKILDVDQDEIEKKLFALNATKVSSSLVIDELFDNEEGRVKSHHDVLRLRTIGTVHTLTYKHEKHTEQVYKVADEYELDVSERNTMKTILSYMGFTPGCYREKYRESYIIQDTKFEYDKYPTIPGYLEIEGSEENIKKYVELLGYTLEQTTPMSASQVLKHYGQDPTNQVFSKKHL